MKSKFSNCSICPLKDQTLVFGETNCKRDISKIELLVLAEAPASEEKSQNRPLVGRSGRIFREAFSITKLDAIPHYLSNVVLCTNLIIGEYDKEKTINPPIEAIELCKSNWQELIKIIHPKLILLLGAIPKDIFGITGFISNQRGKFHKYNNYDVFLTFHPSHILQNGGLQSEKGNIFISDFNIVKNYLLGDTKMETKINTISENKSNCFNTPDWIFAEDLRLIDIQRIPNKNKIVYIMKNTKNERVYYEHSVFDNYCYIPKCDIKEFPMLLSIDNVDIMASKKDDNPELVYYEKDVSLEIKHSIDYYFKRKSEEPIIPLKIQYFDIEVYTGKNKEFPTAKKAEYPINAISFKYDNNKTNVYIVNPTNLVNKIASNTVDISATCNTNWNVTIFPNEKELITAYFNSTVKECPDIITGWNIYDFDIIYIYNRASKIGVSPSKWSPLGFTSINENSYNNILIAGLYPLDLLELYKKYVEGSRASYSLQAICIEELNKGKIVTEGVSLNKLYEENFEKFISYSGTDTDLLYELSEKKGFIFLNDELRKICSSTWRRSERTMGLIDPLMISYAKSKKLVCKNSPGKNNYSEKEEFAGAYVRDPISGIHSWLIDLDFKSLYPSIIISCNIGPDTYIGKISKEDAFNYIYKRECLPTMIDITLNPLNKFESTNINQENFFNWIENNKAIVTSSGCIFMGQEKHVSFFSDILDLLLSKREIYKNKMKDAKKKNDLLMRMKYHNIQLAYKILANSLYGVLGAASFRMFQIDLAETVTLVGQEVTKFLGHHTSKYLNNETLYSNFKSNMSIEGIDIKFMENYDDKKDYLCYQDTDSVFLMLGDYFEKRGGFNAACI